jgi:EXLDI family protein
MYTGTWTTARFRGYDADVPNKTIYVSDGDLPLYARAQELAGGNLSSAITRALRRYVDLEEGRDAGFEEITVRVGPKGARKQRFTGILLGEWANAGWSEVYRVYGTRSGKFVLHLERSPEWSSKDPNGNPGGWRSYLGIGNLTYSFSPGSATLEVFDTLDQLRDRIPEQLYEIVAASAAKPAIEDLDI